MVTLLRRSIQEVSGSEYEYIISLTTSHDCVPWSHRRAVAVGVGRSPDVSSPTKDSSQSSSARASAGSASRIASVHFVAGDAYGRPGRPAMLT